MRLIIRLCSVAFAVVGLAFEPANAAGITHHQKPQHGKQSHRYRPPQIPAGWPKAFMIPKLHVDAPIESLNFRTVSEEMAPLRWNDVAWYDLGPKPGDMGRSEIWGHLDSTCCPAVFYELKTLRKGDSVEVRYKKGRPLTFRVQWSAEYPNTALPLRFMYGPSRDRGLLLFTCAGIFHYDGTGYDHKLIVYATLSS